MPKKYNFKTEFERKQHHKDYFKNYYEENKEEIKKKLYETNWNIEVVRYCYLMEYADDNDLLTHMKNKKHSKKVQKNLNLLIYSSGNYVYFA